VKKNQIITPEQNTHEVIDTRVAKVYKDANDIVVILMKKAGLVNEADIIELNLVIRNHAEKKAIYKLLDARANFDFDKKAKALTEKEERISRTKARAIIVSNSIKASLENFLKEFSHNKYPQQFFTDYNEAYQWLLNLKTHNTLDF
jgi:hypothetical protein